MSSSLHLACNQYAWHTFYNRSGKNWHDSLEDAVAEIAQAGFQGLEPIVNSLDELERLQPLMQQHNLQMRSLYVNSTLYNDEVEANLAQIQAIAEKAQKLFDTKLIVTNPKPISWNGEESKSDAQLQTQAAALNRLGEQLKAQDLVLAYHVHDAELRHAARELHHMLLATNPDNVSFCLDPDWIYRGAGFSQLAVFDIVTLYGHRVSEVHLRQSQNKVWGESFEAGDIDFSRIVQQLKQLNLRPHFVLEQAVSSESPHTIDALEAHRRSVAYANEVLVSFA